MFAAEQIARPDPYGLCPSSGCEHDGVLLEHARIDEGCGVEWPPERGGTAQFDGREVTLELVLRGEMRGGIVERFPDEVHVEPSGSRDNRNDAPPMSVDDDRFEDDVSIDAKSSRFGERRRRRIVVDQLEGKRASR